MPRRKSSLADDLVLVPWWVSLILAIVAPAFLIRMPLPWSAFAPLALLFFLATAALSALRSIKTARMLEGQTSLASLRQLPWKRFEDLLGEVYRRQGYKVEETLGGGGVDELGMNSSGLEFTVNSSCKPLNVLRESSILPGIS
jgi:phosphoglycerol transferase MdoB-like AlkP superfamily enzyme